MISSQLFHIKPPGVTSSDCLVDFQFVYAAPFSENRLVILRNKVWILCFCCGVLSALIKIANLVTRIAQRPGGEVVVP